MQFVALFIALFVSLPSLASTNVYQLNFDNKNYYAIALSPMREAPVRLGVSTTFDVNGERGTHLYSVRDQDQNFTALEFLFTKLRETNSPLLRMQPAFFEQLKSAIYHEHIVHAVEAHLFNAFEEWSIQQYLKRARFGRDATKAAQIEKSISSEFAQTQDGFGWIGILDEQGQIIATLAVAARTSLAPKLSLESRLGIQIPELPFTRTDTYPLVGQLPLPNNLAGPVRQAPHPAPILTLELKRFIIDRKSEIQMLPLLLFVGERTGMTWAGPKTRFQGLYNHRPTPFQAGGHFIQPVIGQYVLESDVKAAEVYMHAPFNFPEPMTIGEDRIFTVTRTKFLEMFWQSMRTENGKISGETFFQRLKLTHHIVSELTREKIQALKGSFRSSICNAALLN